MKPWIRYLGLGAAFYLLFLIAQFPAAQAYRFAAEPLARAVPGLKAGGFKGSIWSGQAGQLIYKQILLGQASWRLSPLPLLWGRASLNGMLQSQDGYLQARVSAPLTGGGAEFSTVEGRLPVKELSAFAPSLPPLLDGMIALNLPTLEVDSGGRLVAAEGNVTWSQAAITAPQALALGDLQMALRTEEGKVVGALKDRGGPLRVTGSVELTPDGAYRLNAMLAAAADAPPELVKSLGWLGKPDSQGRYRLNYSGRL